MRGVVLSSFTSTSIAASHCSRPPAGVWAVNDERHFSGVTRKLTPSLSSDQINLITGETPL